MSAFKVHRVAKVKAPPVLTGSSNSEDKVNDKKGQFKPKGGFSKPPLPGGKPRVVNSSFDSPEATPVRADHNQNKRNPQSAYCYAGVEFRPLHVTGDGGISTAILPPRSRDSSKAVVKPKKEVTPYEEVDIPAGNFDKVNPESFLAEPNQTNLNTLNNSAVAAFTSDMQDMTQACLLMDDKRDLQQSALTHSSGKKPPPLPKPYSKFKEGVDMPDAGKRRTPPPMPKPYNSRNGKERSEEPSQPRGDLEVDAVYAVVQKPSKPKHVVEQKEEKTEEEENIDETPPPLPSRPDFETEEDLRKSQENVVGVDPQEVAEKSNKELSSDNDKPAKHVNAYLVTDIINQPSTKMFGQPEMYEPASDVRDEEETYSNGSDLPEGWQEVNDAGDTYYWHVASGTTQWEKPQKAENVSSSVKHQANHDQQKPKPKTELKTVTSFPVHSMGWLELEESQVAPHNMSDTIAECISNLARQRKDLWKTSETWGEGKDLRLLLESDNLKLVDVQSKATLLVQPISKMRVWGAGRDELKDFAYVARDQATGKHKCHVFRCHGNISGRAIHNKLHEMCNKILAEKKKARGNQQQSSSTKQWSDILNTPPKPSLKDQAGFNVKPVAKVKKSFSAKYIGKVEVPRPSGIDVVHKAIDTATNARDPSKWRTCLIDITVSSVRSTDCMSQQVIVEDRIKFVSFIGVAKDVRLCGYISTSGQGSPFMCYVFQCTPNAASFTKALEEACRLRLQSCLDTNPELSPKLITAEPEKAPEKELKPAAGIKGFLGKLANQTKLGQKRSSEPTSGNKSHSQEPIRSFESPSPSSKYLIKYYGHQPVSVGTGATAIKEAVKAAQGTTLQISNVNIGPEGITLDDSINSGISRRLIHSGRISYCGLASDRIHFGVIEGQGGGKFICHVFAEYKTPVNTIVEAINRVL